jgi:hypothetical protein
MDKWKLIGVASYIQLFALGETVAIMLVALLVTFILPVSAFNEDFPAKGGLFTAVTLLFAILINLNPIAIRGWSPIMFFLTGSLYLLCVSLSLLIIHRLRSLARLWVVVIERFVPLAMIFLILDVLSVAVVLLRNLSEGIV